MLKKIKIASISNAGGRFAIVASKYNATYVDSLLAAAEGVLRKAGVKDIHVVRVPGAYEIPLVAGKLARTGRGSLSAIICLGVIIRGETAHAQLIGEAVTQALMQIQIQHEIPVIHEVLLLENEKQAVARCLSEEHNRGAEAAQTALEMAGVIKSVGF